MFGNDFFTDGKLGVLFSDLRILMQAEAVNFNYQFRLNTSLKKYCTTEMNYCMLLKRAMFLALDKSLKNLAKFNDFTEESENDKEGMRQGGNV